MLSFLYNPTLTSIHDYWKSVALTRQTFVGKVMSLIFNMLSSFYRRQWSIPSPRKRNAKGKMVVWGGLTNSWEEKDKGENERYIRLNVKFQRRARRDKKVFLSDQCKEIRENNKIGKIRVLVKKIKDTKGIFHARMGTIKGRNGTGLTEAGTTKKRWKEYTKELYKKKKKKRFPWPR